MFRVLVCIGFIGVMPLIQGQAATTAATDIPAYVRNILEQEFPNSKFERTTHFLTPSQRAKVDELMGEEPASDLIISYRVLEDGEPKATLFFDTHKVRTASETILIAVSETGAVQKLKTIAFGEPREYLPRQAWFDQFLGRKLSARLALKQDIHGVTGATITARKTTSAARRALALHRVLFGKPTAE
jgi:hypothetical protein